MKKKLLLLSILLLSGLCVNAMDWQPVETDISNLELYLDVDSVKSINGNECLYAIKYQVAGKPEQVAYIKSNSKTNYVGIIQSGDYDVDKYRPNAVFEEPHTFMKPIRENSFLKFTHKYAIALANGTAIAQNQPDDNSNEIEVVYTGSQPILREDLAIAYRNPQNLFTTAEFQEYVANTCKILEQNWDPPATGRNTRAILLLSIGADGSLLNYSFAESSGDNITDRSIISAAEKTVPFPKFPEITKSFRSANFQFVFEHDLLKKSVVY